MVYLLFICLFVRCFSVFFLRFIIYFILCSYLFLFLYTKRRKHCSTFTIVYGRLKTSLRAGSDLVNLLFSFSEHRCPSAIHIAGAIVQVLLHIAGAIVQVRLHIAGAIVQVRPHIAGTIVQVLYI